MIALLAPLLKPVVGSLIDRLVPDKNKRAEEKALLEQSIINAANQANLMQNKINLAEAQHKSIFVAGWRPSIGWICSSGLAWAFVLQPMAAFFFPEHELPDIQTDSILELVFAMLGMAGLRTYERKQGIEKN